MKITKPSQLREGMKLKGKWDGIPVSGYTAENDGRWYLMPAVLCINIGDEWDSYFTDVESVEGIRAAKEGNVLVNKDGDERKVLFANDLLVIVSGADNFTRVDEFMWTWEELETMRGYKLKGEPNPETDPIEVNGKNYHRDQLLERIKELEPID